MNASVLQVDVLKTQPCLAWLAAARMQNQSASLPFITTTFMSALGPNVTNLASFDARIRAIGFADGWGDAFECPGFSPKNTTFPLRYALSFSCASTLTTAFSAVSIPGQGLKVPPFCRETCQTFASAFASTRNQSSLCNANASDVAVQRWTVMRDTLKVVCSRLPSTTTGLSCLPFSLDDAASCGFGNTTEGIQQALSYCAASPKDECCKHISISAASAYLLLQLPTSSGLNPTGSSTGMTWAVLLCVVIANSTLPFICGYVAFKCYKMPILPDPLDDEKADLTANAVRPDTSSHILLGPVTNAGGIIVGARSRLSFAPKVAATQIQPQFQKIYLNVGRANGHFTPVDKNPAGHLSSSNSSPATAPCQSNHGATLSRSGTKKLGPGATSTTLTSFGKTTLKRSATSGRKKVAMAVGPELEAVNAMTKTRQSRSQVPNEKSLNGQSIVKVDVQGLRNRGNRSVSREPKRPSWSDRESPTWNSVPMSSDNQSNDNSNGRRALPLSNAGKVISATRMNRSETKNDSTSNSRNTSSNTRSPSSNWKKSTSRPYSTTLAENQKQKEVQHQGNDELYSSDEEHDSEWEAVVPVSQNKRPPRRDSASNESMLESSNSRIISYYTGRSVRLVSDNSRQDSRVPRGSNNSRASRD